jgi:hypothetical protein
MRLRRATKTVTKMQSPICFIGIIFPINQVLYKFIENICHGQPRRLKKTRFLPINLR